MDILLRSVLIIDPSSPFHQQTTDILIQNGFVAEIGSIDRSADKVIALQDCCVSPGWVDVFSNFCDPGFEYKETLNTGAAAAAAGGYTDVLLVPNTNPSVHTKGGIEYLVNSSQNLLIDIHPIGAITKNVEGKELAEMYDMHQSGAVAFSDGTKPVQSSGILLKALQYVKAIDKIIIQLPEDRSISATGLMNEGISSTRLGLQGKPAIAEEIAISRDIDLAKYTGSKIHFTGISTKRSVEMIRNAKRQGVAVSCSVTPYHLSFTDEELNEYDTNLKVNPPLRTKEDQEALKQALIDGTIDCIATHHMPQDVDHKSTEFEYAADGMIGLETAFAAVRKAVPKLRPDKLVQLFSTNARQLFQLNDASIQLNTKATFSLFFPGKKWTVTGFHSKSKNSAFINQELNGQVAGIINKDKVFLNQL